MGMRKRAKERYEILLNWGCFRQETYNYVSLALQNIGYLLGYSDEKMHKDYEKAKKRHELLQKKAKEFERKYMGDEKNVD